MNMTGTLKQNSLKILQVTVGFGSVDSHLPYSVK
jgi:hypothetical protein